MPSASSPRFWATLAFAAVVSECTCPDHSIAYKDSLFPSPNGAFLANWQACQKSCELSPSCAVFTFKSKSVPPGACWLLPASAEAETDAEAISGPKVCAEPEADAVKASAGSLGAGAPAPPPAAKAEVDSSNTEPSATKQVPAAAKAAGSEPKAHGIGPIATAALCTSIFVLISAVAYCLYRRGAFDVCPHSVRNRKKVARGVSDDFSQADESDMDPPTPSYAPAALTVQPPTGYLTPAAYPTTPMLTASAAPGAGVQLAGPGSARQVLVPVSQQHYAQPSTITAMPGTMAAVPSAMPTYHAVPQFEPVVRFGN